MNREYKKYDARKKRKSKRPKMITNSTIQLVELSNNSLAKIISEVCEMHQIPPNKAMKIMFYVMDSLNMRQEWEWW